MPIDKTGDAMRVIEAESFGETNEGESNFREQKSVSERNTESR